MRKIQPTNAIIAVTLACNARCKMCDIWRIKVDDEVKPSFYERLPSGLQDVNITGGEPFLREDLPEVIEVIYNICNFPRIVISTNGLLTKRIETSIKRIIKVDPKIAVRISLDGIGKEHDEIRGIPGAFTKGRESLRILREKGVKDLGIALTVMDGNVPQVSKVYDLANDWGVEFSIAVVTSSPIYFGEKEGLKPGEDEMLRNGFNYLVRSELRYWTPKRLSRAYFDYTLWNYFHTQKRPLRCDAGQGFFYLDPCGNVYGCEVLDFCLGNLKERSFETIWHTKRASEFRHLASDCHKCWMVCTAKTVIRKSWYKPFFWLIKNKARAHMGSPIL